MFALFATLLAERSAVQDPEGSDNASTYLIVGALIFAVRSQMPALQTMFAFELAGGC